MKSFALATLVAAVSGSYTAVNTSGYKSKTAAGKSTDIWNNIIANTTSQSWYNAVQSAGLLTENEDPTFSAMGDQMPKGQVYGIRDKLIHSVGTISKIKWVSKGTHPYTGMFKGANYGFARLSLAQEPDSKVNNIRPGIGVKLLRDAQESANFVAMFGVDGQSSWNFFENDFFNHIPNATAADTKILSNKFSEQTDWITEVGLSEMATYDQSGRKVTPTFPFALRLHPTGSLKYPSSYHGNFTDDLKTIPSGSTLYQVWAWNKPCALGGKEAHIADIVTTSKTTTSYWGDHHFFIRHQDYAEDLARHSDWAAYSNKYGNSKEHGWGCPFAFLLQ